MAFFSWSLIRDLSSVAAMNIASHIQGMLQSSGEIATRKLSFLAPRTSLTRTRPTELNVMMTQSIDADCGSPDSSSQHSDRAVSSSTIKTRVNNIIHGFAAKALERARHMAPQLTERAVRDMSHLHSTATSLIHDLSELLEAQEVRKQGRILRKQLNDGPPASLQSQFKSTEESSSSSTATLPRAKTSELETPSAAPPSFSSSSISQPLLLPFIERADETEVRYAALIADLCNIAYEATQVDAQVLSAKHRLELVTHCSEPVRGAMSREQYWTRVKLAHASGLPTDQAFNPKVEDTAHDSPNGPNLTPLSRLSSMNLTSASSSAAILSQSSSSLPPIDAAVMSFASRVMDTIEECQLEEIDMTDTCGSGSLRPPSPYVEYSLLLGSIEDIFESMEEEEAHALTRIMSLSRPPTTHDLVRNKLDSMSSSDEYDDVYDPFSVPRLTQPYLPRRDFGTKASNGHGYGSSAPIAIPGASGPGRKVSSVATSGASRHSMPASDRYSAPDLPGSPQAKSLVEQPAPPAAWFVADDPETHVRYIVIQGSVNMDHWAINFRFEPVIFEDPSLGVRVHRGVYEVRALPT